MRLRDPELNDYLDANARWRRALRLKIETPELLRKAGNRAQSQRQQVLLESVRAQLRADMRASNRRAFRGEVSVELVIFTDERNPASAPKSVKRYLDALEQIVYADDRQVGHLLVRRFASDHPAARMAADAGLPTPLVDATERESCSVHVTVTPLRLYIADYDRAFSRRVELMQDRDVDQSARAFFDEDRDEVSYDDLDRLYEERRDDAREEGLYSSDMPGLAETMREFRESQIREMETALTLKERPDRDDRPGPDPGARDNELFASVGLPPISTVFRYELPGTLWLPPLLTQPRAAGEPSWSESARERLEAHRAKWRILPDVFDRPLALDIAIHGAAATTHDIDNVAHTVLKAFEELYCGDRRGTVVTYRVYRQTSDLEGVRVRLMTNDTLRQLDMAIEEARELVLREGPGY